MLHEVDDILNRALGLLEVQGSSLTDGLSQAAGLDGYSSIGGFRP